ncbi:MAG: hypothetical protein AB7S64_11335 [Bacteroides sp.]|jgi:hypothetical protein
MKGRMNMSIPDYQSILLPLLKLAQDGKELLPISNQEIFINRIDLAGFTF